MDYAHRTVTTALHEPHPPALFASLLTTIGDVNIRNYIGNTPLHTNTSLENCKTLIEHGADVNAANSQGITPLHLAGSAAKCRLLLENGASVNAQDKQKRTPLHHACYQYTDAEFAHALLYFGADARIVDRSEQTALSAVLPKEPVLRETLFYLTYDHYDTEEPIHWLNVFGVEHKVPSCLFQQMLSYCSEIVRYDDADNLYDRCDIATKLLQFHPDNLRSFCNKFKPFILDTLQCVPCECNEHNPRIWYEMANKCDQFESVLEILEEHQLLKYFIEYCPVLLKYYCTTWMKLKYPCEKVTPFILILLSNGLDMPQNLLNDVYASYTDCELFRMLTFCVSTNYCGGLGPLMARLIYDVHFSIERLLQDPETLFIDKNSVLDLLDQFALYELKQYCWDVFEDESIVEKLRKLPEVPKLVELARNTTRLFIVDRFKMKNACQLYTYIEHLEISRVYKDLLSFKRKLYALE